MSDYDPEGGREMHKTHSSVDAHHQEMVKVKFVVPNGVTPGQKILVNTPDGHQISVIIPRLAKPGTTITVMVPKEVPSPSRSITNPMREQQETELSKKMVSNDASPKDDLSNVENTKGSDEDYVDEDEDEEDGSGSELDLVI